MCCAAFFLPASHAQSLIVGIPSVDAVANRELMLAFEGQYNRVKNLNYFNSFTFSAYGIGHRTELAASLYGFSNPNSKNRSIGFGGKHWFPIGNRFELKGFVGGMIPFSFDGQGVGYWAYGGVSARIPGVRTRLTAGPSIGTKQIFGTAGGQHNLHAIVGLEQPLTRRWSFVSDWFTGTHDLAAGIFALSYQPNKKWMIISGWKQSNNPASGPSAFIVEITRFINAPKH